MIAWCKTCSDAFNTFPSRVRDGKGAFCSVKCRMQDTPARLAKRFWAKVEKTEGCWLWTAQTDKYGYGVIRLGKPFGKLSEKAARVSWTLHHGPIPKALHVLHTCDNRPCVRPDHLFLGTNADNMHDRDRKLRFGPNVKLDAVAVREIRRRYTNYASRTPLAKEFGVSAYTVWEIARGRTWKHVED